MQLGLPGLHGAHLLHFGDRGGVKFCAALFFTGAMPFPEDEKEQECGEGDEFSMAIGGGLTVAAGDGVTACGEGDGEAVVVGDAVGEDGAGLVLDEVVRVAEEGEDGGAGGVGVAGEAEGGASFFDDVDGGIVAVRGDGVREEGAAVLERFKAIEGFADECFVGDVWVGVVEEGPVVAGEDAAAAGVAEAVFVAPKIDGGKNFARMICFHLLQEDGVGGEQESETEDEGGDGRAGGGGEAFYEAARDEGEREDAKGHESVGELEDVEVHERRDLLQRLPGKEVRGHEEGEAGDGEEDDEGAVAAEREEGRPMAEDADGRNGQEEEDGEEGEAEEALYGAHGCRGEGGHAEVEVLGALRHDLHVEADAVVHAHEGGVEPDVEEEGGEDGAEESFENGAAVFVADGVQVREVDEEDEDACTCEEETGEDVGHEDAGGADDEADRVAACFPGAT